MHTLRTQFKFSEAGYTQVKQQKVRGLPPAPPTPEVTVSPSPTATGLDGFHLVLLSTFCKASFSFFSSVNRILECTACHKGEYFPLPTCLQYVCPGSQSTKHFSLWVMFKKAKRDTRSCKTHKHLVTWVRRENAKKRVRVQAPEVGCLGSNPASISRTGSGRAGV